MCCVALLLFGRNVADFLLGGLDRCTPAVLGWVQNCSNDRLLLHRCFLVSLLILDCEWSLSNAHFVGVHIFMQKSKEIWRILHTHKISAASTMEQSWFAFSNRLIAYVAQYTRFPFGFCTNNPFFVTGSYWEFHWPHRRSYWRYCDKKYMRRKLVLCRYGDEVLFWTKDYI